MSLCYLLNRPVRFSPKVSILKNLNRTVFLFVFLVPFVV